MNKDLQYILIGAAVLAVVIVCYVLAEKFNKYYTKKYGCKGWTWPYSSLLAFFEFFVWYFAFQGGPLLWYSAIGLAISCAVSVTVCLVKAKKAGADTKDTVGAVICQLISSIGVIPGLLILIDIKPRMRRPER